MKTQDILDYIQSAPPPVPRRNIAKHFKVSGDATRVALKKALKELEHNGAIIKTNGGYMIPDSLPAVIVVTITNMTESGDMLARPQEWDEDTQGAPPYICVLPSLKKDKTLSVGDTAMVRLKRINEHNYDARVIKKFNENGTGGRIVGMVVKQNDRLFLKPLDKKAGGRKGKKETYDYEIKDKDNDLGASDGDIITADTLPALGMRRKTVRVMQVIGRFDDPKIISLMSLYEAGLELDFSDAVKKDADALYTSKPDTSRRDDLRATPLITIDGADARDFDDAVFAEPLKNGGFHLIVAIADVAQFVRSGMAIDTEARKRGNSTYFPDRVVPMLPEVLSNDLCSLRPDGDRLCMAVHLYIDASGHLERYKFVRGIMRSHARTTYEQIQAIHDGNTPFDIENGAFTKDNITALYDAFAVLAQARDARGALDLDLPERKIIIDDDGNMAGLEKRIRLDAHRMIEEFMVLANVAAAKALEAKKTPCVYRIHEPPALDKIDSAREFLETFGLSLPRGQVPKPAGLNMILKKAATEPYSHLISQVVLRSQSQAYYGLDNKGHYGLALSQYGHFTSPIRRYADLLVHRALIRAYDLGDGGLSDDEMPQMDQICIDISAAERTSMMAERAAVDRFAAAYLSERTGAVFTGRISGVTSFGLFVTLDESGADGLITIRSLPGRDYYIHDETSHALIGRDNGTVFRLGASVRVRLMNVDALTGSTLFELEGHENGADIEGVTFKPPAFAHKKSKHGGRGKPRHKGKKKKTTPKHKRRSRNKK